MSTSTFEPSSAPAAVPSASRQVVTAAPATPEASWRVLFRLGGLAALVTAVLIPIQVLVFIIWPPPLDEPVSEWFRLFADNWLIGLLSLDLLLLIDYVLLVPLILALAVALRRASPSLVVLGAALFVAAIAAYFASNTAFEMLALSDQYTAATSEGERASYLAAGQAMLATYEGTAFHVNYVLGSLAGIAIGVAMLRSTAFSRWAGYAAIAGNLVGLGLYLPVVGLVLSVISGLVLWVWYALAGWGLLRLGREGAP